MRLGLAVVQVLMMHNLRPCTTKNCSSCQIKQGVLVRAIQDQAGIKVGIEIMMMVGEMEIANGMTAVQIGEIEMVTNITMCLLMNVKSRRNHGLLSKAFRSRICLIVSGTRWKDQTRCSRRCKITSLL
ncbi:hypothetical protein MTR67_030841 [Solanum verrucosum]|uniref:Uncharacterized protein n=1 Tax=Solanum verrucosum TaxID=315347 RepID=A0AAF0ZCS5_SOLVR|nr:hypothetical protein MTR67_030841 [Solanum verrucosum]